MDGSHIKNKHILSLDLNLAQHYKKQWHDQTDTMVTDLNVFLIMSSSVIP